MTSSELKAETAMKEPKEEQDIMSIYLGGK